jgi:ribulose-phosphate 3-epimerase
MGKPERKKIAPSILSADFSRLAEEIRAVEEAGADMIHVDVMDGHFVPNLTVGPPIIGAIRKVTRLPLDVHLMITNADQTIGAFADAGSDYLTVHVEACPHLHRTIQSVKERGLKAGVTLNPATSLSFIEPVLPFVDLVLIMSVNPGFGGQSFITQVLDKIGEMRRMIDKLGRPVELEVDGGIKIENIKDISNAGADVFVAGSAVFHSKNYKQTLEKMRREIDG